MKIEKLTYPSPPEFLQEVFMKTMPEFDLQFGTVFLEKGTRIPEKEWTRHDQTKIVYIVSGKTHLFTEKDPDSKQIVQAGDSFMVEKYEAHRGEIITDTQLIFVLFGKKELNYTNK